MVEVKDSNEIRSSSCPNCYLCGNEGKFLYQSLKDRLFGAPGEWNLKKCSNSECDLVWLDPMPLEEDIGKAYQTYYTHEIQDMQITLLGRLLLTIYSAVKTIPSHLVGLRGEEVQLESMYLSNVSPGRLLEIGFGSGQFLKKMQLCGWEVEGVDFDSKAVEGVKTKYGFNVHNDLLENVKYPNNYFDAVVMNHVIEHIHDPVALLKECNRILKQGGHLVVVTPNLKSLGHQKFLQNWRGLEPPRHLYLFSRKNFATCAINAGFLQVKIFTTSLGIANAIYIASTASSPSEWKKMSILKKILIVIQSLFFKLNEANMIKQNLDVGEEIILLASKL